MKNTETFEQIIETFKTQLVVEYDKSDLEYKTKIPEILERMEKRYFESCETWNAVKNEDPRAGENNYNTKWYCARAEFILSGKALDHYKRSDDYALYYKSNEWIHDNNVKIVNKVITKALDKVAKFCGNIVCAEIELTEDNNIKGIIKGENGVVTIKSVGAGGYNIQRGHRRFLVKSIKN